MNEHDFFTRYAELMKSIEPSKELVAATLARAKEQTAHSGRKTRFRKPYAIAACFVAGALIVGGVGYAVAAAGGAIPSPQSATQAAAHGFTVRAWASDGGTILPTEDGQIVFDRTHSQWTQTGEAEGYFTGCTFTVEGEGISRVQANVSAGELYRQDIVEISQADDPIAFTRATDWDDRYRGLSGTLDSCDSVVVAKWNAAEGENLNGNAPANDQVIKAATLKRYGATVDLAVADAPGIEDGTTCIGLFNPYAAGDPLAPFDGAALTITVTFEDGGTSTQVIVLHEAMFHVEPRYADNSTYFDMTSEITSHTVDESLFETHMATPVKGDDGTYSIASVYGEAISSSSEPFPTFDGTPNEFAETLMPNSVDTGTEVISETEAIPQSEQLQILGQGDVAPAQKPSVVVDEAGNEGCKLVDCDSIVVHAPVVTFSDTPPLGRMKSEFAYLSGFRGDSAYADKWLEQRFGMAFNDDGTLATDGFTFATITVDVENTGSADEDFVGGEENLATLVVVGDDGSVSRISRTSYTLVDEVTAPSHADDYMGTIYTAPASSHVTCTFAYAIPSHFTTDENVYVMVNGKLFPVNA